MPKWGVEVGGGQSVWLRRTVSGFGLGRRVLLLSCRLFNLLPEQVDLTHLLVHLVPKLGQQCQLALVFALKLLVLALQILLLIEPLVATVLRVAPVLEGPSSLLQLGHRLPRKAGHYLVELSHRILGQLLVGQLHLAATLNVGHRDVGTCVLDVRVLVGGRLEDGRLAAGQAERRSLLAQR